MSTSVAAMLTQCRQFVVEGLTAEEVRIRIRRLLAPSEDVIRMVDVDSGGFNVANIHGLA